MVRPTAGLLRKDVDNAAGISSLTPVDTMNGGYSEGQLSQFFDFGNLSYSFPANLYGANTLI